MSRPRNAIPSYRLHKQSGQAIVTLTDAVGTRRDVLLGPCNTPESGPPTSGPWPNGRPTADARLRQLPTTTA